MLRIRAYAICRYAPVSPVKLTSVD